jgi:hypothetical protein
MDNSRLCRTSLFRPVPQLMVVLCLILSICIVLPGHAAFNDWAEGSQDAADGATRDYYNRAGLLEWKNYLGDWRDSDDVAQGASAYTSASIEDNDTPRYIEWDVRQLVQEWVDGTHPNQGFFLHAVSGAGPINFRSKEYGNANQHPQLIVTTGSGELTLSPVADTYLEPSTYRSMGDSDQLTLRMNGSNVLLRFDLSTIAPGTPVTSAILRLYSHTQYGNTTLVAGVYRCAQGEAVTSAAPIGGLAAGFTDDQGIENHPDVIFATGFEGDNWEKEWTSADGTIDVVSSDAPRSFVALQGKALRAKIPEGENSSMSIIYKFADKIGDEPEEIYFRYYLRFADDWNQTVFGGKLPGISGTYGRAGWGGRKPDGTDGWSARGTYYLSISGDNPLAGTHPIGTYCYYADQPGIYGDTWAWKKEYKGFLRKNRWYCVEQYVKMNTPGEDDGIIRAWVDGRPAFEKTDIMFRTVDTLKIEDIWMNVYHGGTAVSPYDQHLYIDNVVVARQYIGPMNAQLQDGPDDPGSIPGSPAESGDPESSPGTPDTPGGGGSGGCYISALQ